MEIYIVNQVVYFVEENMKKVSKNPKIIVNVILLSVFTIHILILSHQVMNPEIPSVKIYDKTMNEINFPLVFKICAFELKNVDARYQKYGYSREYHYFIGKSMYNESIFGWNGHTKKGSTIRPFEGTLIDFCQCVLKIKVYDPLYKKWQEIYHSTGQGF